MLRGVSFVAQPETVAIVGPSGAGKSASPPTASTSRSRRLQTSMLLLVVQFVYRRLLLHPLCSRPSRRLPPRRFRRECC